MSAGDRDTREFDKFKAERLKDPEIKAAYDAARQATTLAALLAEHGPSCRVNTTLGQAECVCGDWLDVTFDDPEMGFYEDESEVHAAHVADVLLASDWLREQRAEASDPKFREFASRSRVFWTFVDHSETGCWIWTGSRKGENNEYGGYAGTTAHRVSWALANGRSARPGEVVRHRCDNGLCVRPDHLEIGTQQDNVDDAVERGRMWFQNRKECKRGHPVSEENTYVYPTGAKTECLTCRKARQAKRNAAYRTTEDTDAH